MSGDGSSGVVNGDDVLLWLLALLIMVVMEVVDGMLFLLFVVG